MKIWKKLLLFSVSVIGLVSAGNLVIWACGGEMDPYDYYTSFFHSDVQGEKDYKAFYFTDYAFLYDDEEPVSEPDINAKEWAGHLGAAVKPADVKKVMYHLDSTANRLVDGYTSGSAALPDSLANNSFLNALSASGNESAMGYFRFAREVEPIANRAYDIWDPTPPDSTALASAAENALNLAEATTDEFIKLRYYYQAQRLYHFGWKYQEASDVYQQNIVSRKSNSHVMGWALSFKAGEARKLGDTVLASYLFSKVFANYPERRLQAYRNYHYMNNDLEDQIKLAKNDTEKSFIYAINGFGKTDMSIWDLKKVYEFQPQSPMVGVLLVREINKLEQNYLSSLLSNNNSSDYAAGSLKNQAAGVTKQAKWPLILGLILIAAAIGTFLITYKKPVRSKQMIGAAIVLLVLGIAGTTWFAFSSGKKDAVHIDNGPQGSFFVSLPDSVQTEYNTHIEKLREFCTTLSTEGKYPDANIGGLANAYLYFMQNKPEEGLQEIDKLDGKKLTAKLEDQKQIVKLLLSAQRLKGIKKVDEDTLLPALKWLNAKAAKADNFQKTERDFYTHVLSPAYLRQGDTAMAAVALLKSTEHDLMRYQDDEYVFYPGYIMPEFWFNFMHSGPMKQILDWRTQGTKEPYLEFLASDLKKVPTDLLHEVLGTIYLREHKYDLAAASLASIKKTKILSVTQPSAYGEGPTQLQGDPFQFQINDYPRDYTTKGLNKLQFARTMNTLQQKLKADPKDAAALFKMGLGLYSTSVDGNSWRNISYMWSSTDLGRAPLYYYDADFIRASNAQSYFLKAREASNDPELKARCTYMLAKCDQKQLIRPDYVGNMDYKQYQKLEQEFDMALRRSKYFEEMKSYSATAFYKLAIDECSYLSDFIRGK